jgi:hypothetical protein
MSTRQSRQAVSAVRPSATEFWLGHGKAGPPWRGRVAAGTTVVLDDQQRAITGIAAATKSAMAIHASDNFRIDTATATPIINFAYF